MKKILLTVAFVATCIFAGMADEYRHVSPITIQLIEFNLDTLRAMSGDNLDIYMTNLTALQKDLEAEKKVIATAQANLKAEKKLYDTQMAFFKGRKAQIADEKKFFLGEVKKYDDQIKNIKKQFETIQKMADVNSPAMQEQTNVLTRLQTRCEEGKDRSNRIINALTNNDEKDLEMAYEILRGFLLELTDKETRLANLANQNKTNIDIVKAQIKNIKAQQKATK